MVLKRWSVAWAIVTAALLAGLVGGNVLIRCPFTLDYQAETLTLYRPETFRPPAGAACSDLVVSYYTPKCPATVAGRREMMVLDTGSSSMVAIHPFLVRRDPELIQRPGRTCYTSMTAGGRVEEAVVPLKDFAVFGSTVSDAGVAVGDNWAGYGRRRVGHIGAPVLMRWRLTFDYRRQKVWTAPARAAQKADPANPDARDFLGNTALMRECSLERARRLIDAGADVNAKGAGQVTPLMAATQWGNLPVVRLLLQKGADPKARSFGGGTPLLRAAMSGSVKMLTALVDAGADVKHRDDAGGTALMSAALRGDKDMVRLLLDRGADLGVADENGRTALMHAATAGHVAAVLRKALPKKK